MSYTPPSAAGASDSTTSVGAAVSTLLESTVGAVAYAAAAKTNDTMVKKTVLFISLLPLRSKPVDNPENTALKVHIQLVGGLFSTVVDRKMDEPGWVPSI